MNNTEVTELKSDLFEEEELSDSDLSTVVGGGTVDGVVGGLDSTVSTVSPGAGDVVLRAYAGGKVALDSLPDSSASDTKALLSEL